MSVSFSKIRLALLDPLKHPPQGADVHIHDLRGDVGSLLENLVMENLVGTGEQQWQPLGDGRWGRAVGREGAER